MQHNLELNYSLQMNAIVESIRATRWLAISIVFLAIAVAYNSALQSQLVFMSVIPLFVLQVFESMQYYQLIRVSSALRRAFGRVVQFPVRSSHLAAAALAVKNSYFLIFLCFDVSWLLKSYVHPLPASTLSEYMTRLQIGPIGGPGFLVFTLLFWLVYGFLFVVGLYRTERYDIAIEYSLQGLRQRDHEEAQRCERTPFSVQVQAYDGTTITLNGFRMLNDGKQPLILWPGFFQNGFVYDLSPGGDSLAEYLWHRGFDIWIIHSRGTGGSGGSFVRCSLDDFASTDIPTVIDFVNSHTKLLPIYVGHSQGGITALMSMMGACKSPDGRVTLSEKESFSRQAQLKGLVTLGSFPDFTFSKPNANKDFVDHGISIKLFGRRFQLVASELILGLVRLLVFVPVPFGLELRRAMLTHRVVKILLAPIIFLLRRIARSGVWEFLYHIPNVGDAERERLFFLTMDGTFSGILTQFHAAISSGAMKSADGAVNYSANYSLIKLPVSFVSMEYDSLADPLMMSASMYRNVASSQKSFIEWKGQGHEDFFMNPGYFPQVLAAIQSVC